MGRIKLWIHLLKNKFTVSYLAAAKRIEHQCMSVGFAGVVGFLGYYFIWKLWLPQHYEDLTLRLIGTFLCFILMFKEYWPETLKRFFPAYWYLTLFYTLPFFFSFMMFKNNFSHMWLMSMLICLFLLILLVDALSLFVLMTSGVFVSFLAYTASGNTLEIAHNYMEDFVLFPFAIYFGILLRYHTDLEAREKLRGVMSAAGSMAHELRTPLLGIKSGIAGLKKYLPILFKGYQLAKEQGLPVEKIRGVHYAALIPVLDRIEEEAAYSNVIIDMMLMNAKKQQVDFSTFRVHSISKCIREALARYPFGSESEKRKVRWKYTPQQDFTFWGSDTLMVHVLFNLLKNALYFITKAEKGEITIWISCQNDMHCLHFKDTGTGIPRESLPHVFDHFYSTTNTGTGIGLSFCKMVMESFEGQIILNSDYGEYTEFMLCFPRGVHHESH